MIDASQQGKGCGRVAIEMTIKLILARYPRCETIRLTCFRANHVAARVKRWLSIARDDAARLRHA
jgi:RimJ/RimL family protein N-acetyltransferase